MQASVIRRRFLDYFISRGHREVPSSSLVPGDDPTLLFTNAGMVQFKRVFQGLEKRDYQRAVTSQKCVRAGGKHNDLEQVGHTDRHLTFFEMLGNFSFGDYFKRDAITFAWEFITSKEWLGIDPRRLRVTVHHTDDEARQLWRELTSMKNERIFSLGDDNFWKMADTGPCGPCSEIFVDQQWTEAQDDSGVETTEEFVRLTDEQRFVEIWNLVFMQFDQQPDGTMVPLPAPSVDTGMGLERTSAVLQGQQSIFHIDAFQPMLDRAAAIFGKPYDRGEAGAAYRVLADHARAVAFLLADGVYPSNEGRGYVLRRILRRAVRHAWLLGRKEPTLVDLVGTVVETMGSHYPDLARQRKHLTDVTRAEEERFLETIEGGLLRMAELKSVSGDEAFKLYDTFGFPIDLTQIIAAERGLKVDVPGFEKLLEQQRTRSRDARKASAQAHGRTAAPEDSAEWTNVKPKLKQKFVGYEAIEAETDILAFSQGQGVLGVVLRENPFYVESGGQVSDIGEIVGKGWRLDVEDVRKIEGRTALFGRFEGPFEPTEVNARINEPRRRDTERNHSVTHLVHWALRRVLGTHVRQAGSVVMPERMRFDFTHHSPLGAETLANVEHEVNEWIWKNVDVTTDEMAYDKALTKGAMALFGEKYGDKVRVVTMGPSVELCGGTHVRTSGQIGFLKLVSEGGVGAGVRRVEALTGPGAFEWFRSQQRLLEEAAGALGSTPEHLARRASTLAEEKRKLEKRLEDMIRKGGVQAESQTTESNGTSISVTKTPANDRAEIGTMVDTFRGKTKSGVLIVFADGERPGIHVGVTDDLVSRGVTAGDLVNRLAALAGGKGGGRPHFASAGAASGPGLEEAERRAAEIVKGALEASR